MKNTDILKKTMPFVWTRFGLYLLTGLALVVYMVIVLFLCVALGGESISLVIGLIAVIIGIGIYMKVSDYINYLVKAAHVAVIAELAEYGHVPENTSIVKYGQEQVKKRFVATTVFYGLDSLVSGAVKQIQNVISKIGGIFGNIKAVENIVTIINLFVGIVLGYVDEAVLAHIFSKKEEGAWKGAADGVVLYFQNWKAILKNAVGLVLFIVAFYVVGSVIFYSVFYGLAILIFDEGSVMATIITLVLAVTIMLSIKESFVDSWITISVVNRYIQVTTNQVPEADLYGKAQGYSKKFKELCGKAEAESSNMTPVAAGAAGVAGVAMAASMPNAPVNPVVQPQTPVSTEMPATVQPTVAPVQEMPQVQQAPVAPVQEMAPVQQAPVAPVPMEMPAAAPIPVAPVAPVQEMPQVQQAPVAPVQEMAPVAPAPMEMPAATQTPVAPVAPVQEMPQVQQVPVAPVQPTGPINTMSNNQNQGGNQ